MGRTVEKRSVSKQFPQLMRVAAYARVSSAKDAMHHSLSSQISYYSGMIQSNPAWRYVGVYADEAKTGTKDTRPDFQRLLADCRSGLIDMVITKSISRFARNTVTLLETVRELKGLGIDIFFEEQNIHSKSRDGEMVLTLLASFAQEESLSVSENQKWRVRKNFREGRPWNTTMLGYRNMDGKLTVEPAEADTVRFIFSEYLSGKGQEAIMNDLNRRGIPTRKGGQWCKSSVSKVLQNYAYTGNLLLQTTYSENHLTKRRCTNDGLLPMYHAQDTHEAIISTADYEAVQAEMKRRAEAVPSARHQARYPFTGMITCRCCGAKYRRKVRPSGPVWICSTYNSQGKAACPSKQIPETILEDLTADIAPGDLTALCAENGNTLVLTLSDGKQIVKRWEDRSRAKSWTPEMREAARQKNFERMKANG